MESHFRYFKGSQLRGIIGFIFAVYILGIFMVIANSSKIKPMQTKHVFVKHRCPRQQQSPNIAKISKSYILTPPDPQGHQMSVKCEEPLNELTVQVWLLYNHPNFNY